MERRNYVDVIRCRRNEKGSTMWKIRMVSVHTSIVVNKGGEVFGIVVELNSRQQGQAVVSCPQDG